MSHHHIIESLQKKFICSLSIISEQRRLELLNIRIHGTIISLGSMTSQFLFTLQANIDWCGLYNHLSIYLIATNVM